VTPATVLASVFLLVSCVSFAVQLASLLRIATLPLGDSRPVARAFNRGLLRTSVCRVLAMAVNVVIGVTVLFAQTVPVVTLIVFSAVQTMWMINGRLDVRLQRWAAQQEPLPAQPSAVTERRGTLGV
jgi:hypothetical protein